MRNTQAPPNSMPAMHVNASRIILRAVYSEKLSFTKLKFLEPPVGDVMFKVPGCLIRKLMFKSSSGWGGVLVLSPICSVKHPPDRGPHVALANAARYDASASAAKERGAPGGGAQGPLAAGRCPLTLITVTLIMTAAHLLVTQKAALYRICHIPQKSAVIPEQYNSRALPRIWVTAGSFPGDSSRAGRFLPAALLRTIPVLRYEGRPSSLAQSLIIRC